MKMLEHGRCWNANCGAFACFNCLHMQSFGNDGFHRVLLSSVQFNFHDKNRHRKYKFRDLFARVHSAGDKANCEIFVNGPSIAEMHIACHCRERKKVSACNVIGLIAVEVDDTCWFYFVIWSDNHVFVIMKLMELIENELLVIHIVNRLIIEDNEVSVTDTFNDRAHSQRINLSSSITSPWQSDLKSFCKTIKEFIQMFIVMERFFDRR